MTTAHPSPMRTPMSPSQAAQLMNVSRRTIMRAIERHELIAVRDNRNHWKISHDELERWAGAQCAPSERDNTNAPTLPTPQDSAETLDKIARLETERDQLRERLDEVKADRERWYEEYKKATQKGDPIPILVLPVLLAVALGALTTAVTTKDPSIENLSILFGGALVLLCAVVARDIRKKRSDK